MTPTIGQALDLLADRDPSALAVDDGRRRLDRAALRDASRAFALRLIARGVRADDLVPVLTANDAASIVAICGVWRAGATPVPFRADGDPVDRAVLLGRIDPRLVIDPATDVDLDADAAGADGPPPLAASAWKASPTSGSTGVPKLVVSTVPARVDPDRPAAPFLPLGATQLVSGPLGAAAAFTYAMRGLTTGHSLVLLPRFDVTAVLTSIAAHRVTWTLLPPAMLHRLDRDDALPGADLSSLAQVVHLGAPIDPELKRRWLARLGPHRLTEVYAGTESNGVVMIRGDEWLAHPGSVGRPVSGTEVRIVGAGGAPVAAGTAGRVELRRAAGPSSFVQGAPPQPPDAWSSLGDDGVLDADGWLFLIDRGVDRIVRGGVDIAPAAVEQALERHPAVRSAIAVGVDDDELGQRVHAVADVAGSDVTAEDLLAFARRGPGPAPDTIELVREPLRDDAGKARRSAWRPVASPNGGAHRG